MKNATRLSPEAIERLQETARVDEGIETSDARDLSTKRGVASFSAAEPGRVLARISPEIFEWFCMRSQPGESADAAIDRVLAEHIAAQMKEPS